jgi:hypothetical protein
MCTGVENQVSSRTSYRSQLAETLPHLQVGDSVLAPFTDMTYKSQLTFISRANLYDNPEGRKYITRHVDENHNRIWRVK